MVKVSVIGGGNLGIKVACELAYHGHEVRLYDRSPEVLDRIQLRIKEEKRLLNEDGILMTPNFIGEIYYISRLEDAVKASDFIFESVPDELPLKQDLFEWISQCCRHDAIIATNTLHLKCDEVVERAVNKERCLGVRFLFPVLCVPEVEITPAKLTSVATIEKVRQFLARMGKTGFLRSGPDPLILSNNQREQKKTAFLRNLQENPKTMHKQNFRIPDLGTRETYTSGFRSDSEEPSSRENDCVICMDEERNCVLHPCHHLCTCCTCGRMLVKRQDACPICRKHIVSVFRIFHS